MTSFGRPLCMRILSFLRFFLLAVSLVVVVFFAPAKAKAQDIVLTNVAVQHEAGNVILHFSLDLKDVNKLRNLLLDGASLMLECEAELSAKRSYWFNEDISSASLSSPLRSDSLTREFLLALPGQEQPLKNDDLEELLKNAWQGLTLDLGPDGQLKRGEQYIVTLEAELKYSDVPPWMKQTLFFWSWEAAPPAVHQLEFTY